MVASTMEDNECSKPSGSCHTVVINGETVADVLRAARLLGNAEKEAECLRFLRNVDAPGLMGELRFLEIGKEFDIEFIQERTATLVVFASIANAIYSGQSIHSYRNQVNCNFVAVVDTSEPVSPLGIKEVTNRTLLRTLRWGYKQDNLLVLKEFEKFLASYYGSILFNEYQLLHLANRFDLPHIRIGLLMQLRTMDQIEAFKSNNNYEIQLSVIDKELFESRTCIIKDCIEKGEELNDDIFTYDVRNACTAVYSITTRYAELSEEEIDQMYQKEEKNYGCGFNSELCRMFF